MAEKNFKVLLSLPDRFKEKLEIEADKKALSINSLIRLLVAEYVDSLK